MTARARNEWNARCNDVMAFYSGLQIVASRPGSDVIYVEGKTLVVTASTISVCANGRRWNYNRKTCHFSSEDISKTT